MSAVWFAFKQVIFLCRIGKLYYLLDFYFSILKAEFNCCMHLSLLFPTFRCSNYRVCNN